MRARSAWSAVGGAIPVVALFVDGCRTPTQVTLDIGTNVVCADMRGVEVVVAGDPREAEHRAALDAPGIRYATATTGVCTEGASPRPIGTLVVTPGGGSGAVVVVAAFGGAKISDCMAPNFGPGCIVARRRFAFADHTASTLPIVLDPVCSGVPCNESSTCVGKKCVDSAVDCASGTCTDPGQRSPDGGLVEVDSASPLDSAMAADAPVDAPRDGSGDATQDAPAEGGGDAGAGRCPTSTMCDSLAPATCAAAGIPVACCYETNPATCKAPGNCATLSGCCRSSLDCTGGDICCASTRVASAATVIDCRPRNECQAAGAVVCSTVGGAGCGGGACIAAIYSAKPDYYLCS